MIGMDINFPPVVVCLAITAPRREKKRDGNWLGKKCEAHTCKHRMRPLISLEEEMRRRRRRRRRTAPYGPYGRASLGSCRHIPAQKYATTARSASHSKMLPSLIDIRRWRWTRKGKRYVIENGFGIKPSAVTATTSDQLKWRREKRGLIASVDAIHATESTSSYVI